MNKSELIDRLTDRLGSRKQAQEAVEAVVDTITRAVAAGEKVVITGFGAFEKVERAARTARNPRTGDVVKVKKSFAPKFKAGAELKAVVSGAKKLPKVAVVQVTRVSTAAGDAAKKAAPAKRTTAKSAAATPAKAAAKKAPAKKAPGEEGAGEEGHGEEGHGEEGCGEEGPRQEDCVLSPFGDSRLMVAGLVGTRPAQRQRARSSARVAGSGRQRKGHEGHRGDAGSARRLGRGLDPYPLTEAEQP